MENYKIKTGLFGSEIEVYLHPNKSDLFADFIIELAQKIEVEFEPSEEPSAYSSGRRALALEIKQMIDNMLEEAEGV